MTKIQHKRSSLLSGGSAQAPTTSQLDYGELAINYNSSDPQLFIKDSSGSVVSILNSYAALADDLTFTGDVSFDGEVTIKGDSTNGSGQLTLNCESNVYGVKIKAPANSAQANYTLTLPTSAGSSSQLLATDGSGNLSWAVSSMSVADKNKLDGIEVGADVSPWTTSTNDLYYTTGRVGIGNSSPGNFSGGSDDLVIGNSTQDSGITIVSGTSSAGNLFFTDSNSPSGSDAYRGYVQYDHGTDVLNFGTGAVKRLTLDNSGNCGVGTSNPNRKTVISQANSTAYSSTDFDQDYHLLKLENTSDSQTAGLQFLIGSNGEAAITATETSDGATDLCFGTRGSGSRAERLRISSTGLVGIGRAPDTTYNYYTLQVRGPSTGSLIHFSRDGDGTTTNADGMLVGIGTGDAYVFSREPSIPLTFGVADAVTMQLDTSGRLLLNKGTDVRIELGTSGTTGTNDRNHVRADGIHLKYNTCANGSHVFETNGTESMRIESSNLGIGTTAPQQRLHLKGNYFRIDDASQSYGTMHIGAENGVNSFYSQAANAGAGAHPLRFMIGNSTEMLRIDSSGVGIGMAANDLDNFSRAFNVTGAGTGSAIYLHKAGSTTNYGYLGYYDTTMTLANRYTGGALDFATVGTGNMRFSTNGSVRVTLDGSGNVHFAGNVGIGTTPAGSTDLTVNGDTHFASSGNTFKAIQFTGVGGNSNNGSGHSYAIYQGDGGWSLPYPDLWISYHTGINLGAHSNYNGIRFYSDAETQTKSLVMSINDSSTGLGAFNVYVQQSLQANSSLRAPIFYDSDDTSYYIDANGYSYQKYLGRRAHETGFLVGSYNSVGANSYYSNPIYAIGHNYMPNASSLGGFYGCGYTHATNASFVSLSGVSGWGLYVASGGTARIFLDSTNGHIACTGSLTSSASDQRLKTNITPIKNALEKVSQINGVEYDWIDECQDEYEFTPTQKHEVGVIAQEIQKVLPEVVVTAPFNGSYTEKTGWKKIKERLQSEENVAAQAENREPVEITKAVAKDEFEKLPLQEREAMCTDHNFLTVNYEKITPLLIEAIKELSVRLTVLESN